MQLSEIVKPTLAHPRTATETDLVHAVHSIMVKQGYSLASLWLSDSEILEAKPANSDLQRFLISRNLRIKLGMSKHPTSIERFSLEYSGSEAEWLKNVSTYVVPALVRIASELN